MIDTFGDSTLREIDVWSPDTDVLILLMDLVAHGRLGALKTKLKFLTGKANKFRSNNIREHVSTIGQEKYKGLIGWMDSPTSQLPPTLQVIIISSLVTLSYAQRGMHRS